MPFTPDVLPPHTLIEREPVTVHPRLALVPDVGRRAQLRPGICLDLKLGKRDNLARRRVRGLEHEAHAVAGVLVAVCHAPQRRFVRCLGAEAVRGLAPVAVREDLIGMFRRKGVEFNVDQLPGIERFRRGDDGRVRGSARVVPVSFAAGGDAQHGWEKTSDAFFW